MTDYQLNKA